MKYTLRKLTESENMPETFKNSKKRGKSLLAFLDDYVVLDIETTGLNPKFDEIIELSALKVVNNEIKEEFNSLVNPKRPISSFITNLTGIDDTTVKDAPHIKDAILKFHEFCSDSVVMGHNVTFDINFIAEKLSKYHNLEFSNDYIDTLRIARKLLPKLKDKKLGTIAAYFNLNTDGMHRGLKDCKVTNLCFTKFKELVQPQIETKSLFS